MAEDTSRIIEGIRDYWQSEHWQRFLHFLQEKDGERVYHIHHYVDTCVHPESLTVALQYYFAKQGWEIDREIDVYLQSPRPIACIHGVCPKNMPHFDINFRFRPDVVLGPMAPDGAKQDLQAWGESYMKNFYSQFPFRSVGKKEEEAIEAWFRSPQWERACAYCEDPKVVHLHVNVVTSVHPDVIAAAAMRAFKREGWTVWDQVPCVFDVRGTTTGKLVTMLSYPQQIFDICWRFDPDVIIAPSPKPFLVDADPEFDVRTQGDFQAFLDKDPYAKLTRAQLRETMP